MAVYIVFGGLWSCKSRCILHCLGVGRLYNSNLAGVRDHGSLIVRSGSLPAFPGCLLLPWQTLVTLYCHNTG